MSRETNVAIARRYFEVLDLLAKRRKPLVGVDIGRQTSVPLTAIYVHLGRMQGFGWLDRDERGYSLTALGRAAHRFAKLERAA